jgi:flagellar export protein FliJ
MPFRFSLASVLRLRESIEKREEVALKTVQLEVLRVRRRIDELTDEMTKAWEERERALQKPIQATHLQALQAEINTAEEARQILIETMHTLRQQRDAQMKNYKTARSERQMLTNLSAQKKSAYEQDQARRQQKSLDDIVAARWQRS